MKTKATATWMLLAVWVTGLCGVIHADNRDGVGVGIMVGEPTGISLKKWVGQKRAVDAGIAWSFTENDSLHLHGDYLFHRFDDVTDPELPGMLPFYFGVGARVKLQDENNGNGRNDADDLVGIRVPFGLSYLISNAPMDVFVEIVPILDVVPDTDLDLNAAVGVRYYF